MKFGTLTSVAHNMADSLASGIGMMIGVYELHVFEEAAATPEGFIEVDFLTGSSSGGKPSCELARAFELYAAALPDLCRRQSVEIADFREFTARFSGRTLPFGYTVTIEDRLGRRPEMYIGASPAPGQGFWIISVRFAERGSEGLARNFLGQSLVPPRACPGWR